LFKLISATLEATLHEFHVLQDGSQDYVLVYSV